MISNLSKVLLMNLTERENVTGLTGFVRFLQVLRFSVKNFNGFNLKSPILDVRWFQNSYLTLTLISHYIQLNRGSRVRTFNNILLHVPNHALKDVYMFNYGIMKNTNRPYYTRFFVIIISYNLIKTDSLGFLHIPYYF